MNRDGAPTEEQDDEDRHRQQRMLAKEVEDFIKKVEDFVNYHAFSSLMSSAGTSSKYFWFSSAFGTFF